MVIPVVARYDLENSILNSCSFSSNLCHLFSLDFYTFIFSLFSSDTLLVLMLVCPASLLWKLSSLLECCTLKLYTLSEMTNIRAYNSTQTLRNTCNQGSKGIRHKTLADKLMYIPNDITQNYPFCRLKLPVKTFEH